MTLRNNIKILQNYGKNSLKTFSAIMYIANITMTSHDITWLKYGEGYLIFYDWHNGITKVMENEGSTERWKRRTQEWKRWHRK